MSSTISAASNDLANPQPNDSGGFQSFENAAADAVLAISYNSTGKHLAVASADHKVRIYENSDQKSNTQAKLIDQWRAHEAEILDVQWIPGLFPGHFATTASDNKIKIWREDPSQAPLSGRRFRCIFSQSPGSHVPYTSFSFHALEHEIYLALFTQDGLFSLLEPTEPGSLASWQEIDQLYPFGRHTRGTEPRFCLTFHQSPSPSTQALLAALPPKTLSLAVSASSLIKIYRALPSSTNSSTSYSPDDSDPDPITTAYPPEPNYSKMTEFLELDLDLGPGTSINHLAWCPGCMTPYDVLATACDDGTVRILDVLVPASAGEEGILKVRGGGGGGTRQQTGGMVGWDQRRRRASAGSGLGTGPPPHPTTLSSGIGAGLAGMGTTNASEARRREGAAEFRHEWRESAVLSHGRGKPCWNVKWTFDGSAVASVGDDGEVVLWRRGIEGMWLEWSRTRLE